MAFQVKKAKEYYINQFRNDFLTSDELHRQKFYGLSLESVLRKAKYKKFHSLISYILPYAIPTLVHKE